MAYESEFVNLTPHPVNIYGPNSVEEGPQSVISPSGEVARIAQIELGSNVIYGIPYCYVEYGRLENPPPVLTGRFYIVSLVAALAIRGRDDIFAPFDEVRNESGTIIGCRCLQRVC